MTRTNKTNDPQDIIDDIIGEATGDGVKVNVNEISAIMVCLNDDSLPSIRYEQNFRKTYQTMLGNNVKYVIEKDDDDGTHSLIMNLDAEESSKLREDRAFFIHKLLLKCGAYEFDRTGAINPVTLAKRNVDMAKLEMWRSMLGAGEEVAIKNGDKYEIFGIEQLVKDPIPLKRTDAKFGKSYLEKNILFKVIKNRKGSYLVTHESVGEKEFHIAQDILYVNMGGVTRDPEMLKGVLLKDEYKSGDYIEALKNVMDCKVKTAYGKIVEFKDLVDKSDITHVLDRLEEDRILKELTNSDDPNARLKILWRREIKPRFEQKALNHKVQLLNGALVRYVNLDNAATTTPFLAVTIELQKELDEYGSVHRGAGDKSKISTERYEEARESVHEFVNGKTDRHYSVFTPNTTIGMNQLAYFFANIKGKVMVSDIEHSSSMLPWIFQEGRHQTNKQVSLEDTLNGYTEELNGTILERGKEKVITYGTKSDFTFDLNDIEKVLSRQRNKDKDGRVKVLVVTGASNVTGYKPPIKELAELAHEYSAMIVVDGCQLLQHEQIDMQKQGIDFVVFSGHKMYAPFGSGAIVGDKRILDAFWPYQMGGGNFPYITKDGKVLRYKTDQAHDPGTPNFAGARALHYAIKELQTIGIDKISEYEHALVEYAFDEIEKISEVKLNVGRNSDGNFDRSLITFNIEGMPHNLAAEVLNHEYGIGVRAGSYCVHEFSRRIHGITPERDAEIAEEVRNGKTANIPGSIRASFGMYNTFEDVDRFIFALREIEGRGFEFYKNRYRMDEMTGNWNPTNIHSVVSIN